jgi:RecB family exonuclease
MSFLKKIAQKFVKEYQNQIHRLAFVFPTRRAGLYFRRHLQDQLAENQSIWAPQIFSINDFIIQLSELSLADPLDLIFDLYQVYDTKVGKFTKKFQEFYPWGKMIISDFNEIDKYLIDQRTLFRTLKEYKKVQEMTQDEEKSEILNNYIGFWEDLGEIYQKYKSYLEIENRGYEGMIYRQVAEGINDYIKHNQKINWDITIFCGFNALNQAEEKIINSLLKANKAEIFWDMDKYFVEDTLQEAGLFFREHLKKMELEPPQWVSNQLLDHKNISIIGAQSKVSQAKLLGIELPKFIQNLPQEENIAVILPDETLLFPTLNSIPDDIQKVNITIGYPLQQTPVYTLANTIMEMQIRGQKNLSSLIKTKELYFKDVISVMNHPYIKPIFTEEVASFIEKIKDENLIYISQEDTAHLSPEMRKMFIPIRDSLQFIVFFLELLDLIRSYYAETESELFSIDLEYIYHFYTLISRLKDSLTLVGPPLDMDTFRQLFNDIIIASRIPFTGEPLEGMQIMGMLETQTLDFPTTFILSMNEGYLPPSKVRNSFIPFDVRIQVGLPTYKDRDAIAAYHFYRLLSHSKNTFLFYTAGSKGLEKNEKSRFIDQILIEYSQKNPKANISHQIIDFNFDPQPTREISINKSHDVLDILYQKSYSASSLLTYLSCSLKFYFSYVLKLKEDEDMAEDPDHRIIGNIIHDTLKDLYMPYCTQGKIVKIKDLDYSLSVYQDTLENSYLKFLKNVDLKTGRNKIIYEVITRFLNNFFRKERKQSGFKLLLLEEKIQNIKLPVSIDGENQQVHLEGTIDRLDFLEDKYRIIDYKTGKIGSLTIESMDQLSREQAVTRREVFQLFFYYYLLQQTGKYPGDYVLGIYPLKRLKDDLKLVKVENSHIIEDQQLELFEDILKDIFKELLNGHIPFTKTEEEKHCTHCPYVHICTRESVEYSY